MTDFGIRVQSAEGGESPRDPARYSRVAVSTAAAQCVRLRREMHGALGDADDPGTLARALRDRLRECVIWYVDALRLENFTPERTIVMVKTAVLDADWLADVHRRQLVEEAVRWAVDAYYSR